MYYINVLHHFIFSLFFRFVRSNIIYLQQKLSSEGYQCIHIVLIAFIIFKSFCGGKQLHFCRLCQQTRNFSDSREQASAKGLCFIPASCQHLQHGAQLLSLALPI